MYYFTAMQPEKYHQVTLEELLFGDDNVKSYVINSGNSNTITYEREHLSANLVKKTDVQKLIDVLQNFNKSTVDLRATDRRSLYETFHIPKKTGGLRRIDAPKDQLMNALRQLKTIFEQDFHALYHTSAFAYIKNRSTIDAVKRHQGNQSKWFGKFDLSDFFGSTTLDFVMKQLSKIYPFCLLFETTVGRSELSTAVELAFLDGVLPQGTPISPLLTNLMMIPVDFTLTKRLREFEHQSYTYTRYADDFIISSKHNFEVKKVEQLICDVLMEFEAPFTINEKKTRYGSSHGSNWNLGLMLNKDNEITIGHKKKKQFQSMLHNYIFDKKNGKDWEKYDVQVLDGLCNYYKMVEREAIENIITHMSRKMNVDIFATIKSDLKNL